MALGEQSTKENLSFGQTDNEAQSDEANKPDEKELVSDKDSRKAYIKKVCEDVRRWRAKWKPDFDRMKSNMAFVSGLQWEGQKKIHSDKYVANFTNQLLAQKVSRLYARNPQFSAEKRKRRDFAIWDKNPESIVQALTAVQQSMMLGAPPPMEALALMQDYEQGMQWQKHVKDVGESLEILYQYQTDSQEPEFKTQMKQLVHRTSVCGVGYVRLSFCRNYDKELTQSHTRLDIADRSAQAKAILEKLEKGDLKDHDAKIEQLQILIHSIENSVADNEQGEIQEKLIFDFLPATSVIPDDKTRCLIGFIGTDCVAQEYILPLDYVNDYFELRGDDKISMGGETIQYNDKAEAKPPGSEDGKNEMVCLWDVFNRTTKSHCIVCDGWYNNYVQAPEPVEPMTKRFWPIFPLCFNKVETEKGSDCSIFPPSDVDLVRSAQKEWNRTREALRDHRNANAPGYVTSKGMLSDEDIDNINNCVPNQVIELKNVPPGTDPDTVIRPKSKVPIDPAVYDTKPLSEDTLITTGTQEANLGPPQPNTTATGNTIAEQSRMSTMGSNVDDIDDFLSALAEAGGEMMLREFSPETVQRIVGRGVAWPSNPAERIDFMNALYLQVKAASSGRPNQAIAVANWERLGPLLMQMGANPQAMIKETIKRLDDQAEPSDFFPIPGVGILGGQPPGAPANGGQQAPSPQPLPALSTGEAVPLAGA